jgi:hypothetical protein
VIKSQPCCEDLPAAQAIARAGVGQSRIIESADRGISQFDFKRDGGYIFHLI